MSTYPHIISRRPRLHGVALVLARCRVLVLSILAAAGAFVVIGAAQGAGNGFGPDILRTLTIVSGSDGSGTVTAAGINCTITDGSTSGDCSQSYLVGTEVAVTPVVAAGSLYYGCYVQASPKPCTFTMSADTSVEVRFAKGHLVSVSKNGSGFGTVTSALLASASAIDCGNVCSHLYSALKVPLVLTATAAPGSVFVGWGGACAGTPASAPCKLAVTKASSVTIGVDATFNSIASSDPPVPPTVDGGGGGVGGGGVAGGGVGDASAGSSSDQDTTLDARVVAVKAAKSVLGRRLVRVEIAADEVISVRLQLRRDGFKLAGRTVRRFKEGRRVVELFLASSIPGGKARLTITLTDQAGNARSPKRTIHISSA